MTNTTNTVPANVAEEMQDIVSKALLRAWQLGQTYLSQADSDSFIQNKKSDETQAKFNILVDETRAALAAPAQAVPAMPEIEAERFIKAAIDGAPEPFRRLGEFLSGVLDEDQWAAAQRLLLGGLMAVQDGRDVQSDIDHYNENMG